MPKEENNKIMRLCSDVIFKAVFLREQEVLLKMFYDIIGIEDKQFKEVITGYELEPYK